jgi:hypothetical protein
LKWCPDVVLVHQATTTGSGTSAGDTGVSLLTPPLHIVP